MALFAVVAAVAGYGVYQTQANEVAPSALIIKNVEALAGGEDIDPLYRLFPCPEINSGNQCCFSQEDRPKCGYVTYCN